MRQNGGILEPDNTAVRTALWRALHLKVDAEPLLLEDEIGLKLIAPNDDWQQRPDMKFTKRLQASIIARARFIEDLIVEQCKQGISQYVYSWRRDLTLLPSADQILPPNFRFMKLINPIH